jgi:hypothetical protein
MPMSVGSALCSGQEGVRITFTCTAWSRNLILCDTATDLTSLERRWCNPWWSSAFSSFSRVAVFRIQMRSYKFNKSLQNVVSLTAVRACSALFCHFMERFFLPRYFSYLIVGCMCQIPTALFFQNGHGLYNCSVLSAALVYHSFLKLFNLFNFYMNCNALYSNLLPIAHFRCPHFLNPNLLLYLVLCVAVFNLCTRENIGAKRDLHLLGTGLPKTSVLASRSPLRCVFLRDYYAYSMSISNMLL